MRICLINDIEIGGGAANVATGLAEGLCRSGHEVTRIVDEPDGTFHSWKTVQLVPESSWLLATLIKLSRKSHLVPPSLEYALSIPYQHSVIKKLRQLLAEIRPDIINIHNIHASRWSPSLVIEMAKWAEVVWTLHDTWSFTGRCCVESECKLFITECNSSCPTSNNYPRLPRWRIRREWNKRRRMFQSIPNLTAITPSKWLADYARQGLWVKHQVEVIPNGVDTDIFRPKPKHEVRKLLEIPDDRPVLLMSAGNITDKLKGGDLLHSALLKVETPLTILLLGFGTWSSEPGRHRVISMGYVNNPRLLALVYSSADLVGYPTLADNLPVVLMEAVACGIPCVCTPVGGCPEIVREGESGWVAEDMSPHALARAINQALSDLSSGKDFSISCRALAEREFNLDLMVSRYQHLFETLAMNT